MSTASAVLEQPAPRIVRPCPEIHVRLYLAGQPYFFRCSQPGSRTFLLGHPGEQEPPYQIYVADQEGTDNDTCTCPDFRNRHTVCKHIQAIRAFLGKIGKTFYCP